MPRITLDRLVLQRRQVRRMTINSVRAPTNDDWEHIVEDGSTDGSVDAITSTIVTDPRVTLIRQANG